MERPKATLQMLSMMEAMHKASEQVDDIEAEKGFLSHVNGDTKSEQMIKDFFTAYRFTMRHAKNMLKARGSR